MSQWFIDNSWIKNWSNKKDQRIKENIDANVKRTVMTFYKYKLTLHMKNGKTYEVFSWKTNFEEVESETTKWLMQGRVYWFGTTIENRTFIRSGDIDYIDVDTNPIEE